MTEAVGERHEKVWIESLVPVATVVHISQDRCTPCIVLLRFRFIEIFFRLWACSYSSCDLVVAEEHTGSYLFTLDSYVIRNTVQALLSMQGLSSCCDASLFWQDQCDSGVLLAAVSTNLCLGRWRPIKPLIMWSYKVCVHLTQFIGSNNWLCVLKLEVCVSFIL